jgi:hypothetical protein
VSQLDCTWVEQNTCRGTSRCRIGLEACEICGCGHWDFEHGLCESEPDDCDRFLDETQCLTCNCEWVGGNCTGIHHSCIDYPNADICNSQLDCYWSACVNYLCT